MDVTAETKWVGLGMQALGRGLPIKNKWQGHTIYGVAQVYKPLQVVFSLQLRLLHPLCIRGTTLGVFSSTMRGGLKALKNLLAFKYHIQIQALRNDFPLEAPYFWGLLSEEKDD